MLHLRQAKELVNLVALGGALVQHNLSHVKKHNPILCRLWEGLPTVIRYGNQVTVVNSIEKQLQDRDLMLDELKSHLVRAQEKMKVSAEKHRWDVQFEVGDLVYVKLHPYHLQSLAKKPNEKLGLKYFGPFEVMKGIGLVVYHLQLLPTATIHPVFHVPTKESIGSQRGLPSTFPHLNANLEWIVELDQILGIRQAPPSQPPGKEALIQWKDLPQSNASWESVDSIIQHFPNFHLEDKVSSEAGGIDRPLHSIHLF